MIRPKIVELVGPAGSGKSALVDEIRRQYSGRFSYIGKPKISVYWRIVSRLQAHIQLKSMKGAYRLPRREKSRIFKGMVTVIQGQRWIAQQKKGHYILDEGPIRIMMDYACHSKRQFVLWRLFCERFFSKLSDKDIIVVHVCADQELRFRRRMKRMSQLEKEDSLFNPKAKVRSRIVHGKLVPDLFFNRENMIGMISSRKNVKISEITICNDADLSVVAKKLVERVGLCG